MIWSRPMDVDLAVDDLQAQRLEQAGGEALPLQVVELVVDAGDDPDVAAPGAEGGGVAVGEEVEAGEAQPGVVRVVVGRGDRVHDVGGLVAQTFAGGGGGDDALGGEHFGPVGGAASGEGGGVGAGVGDRRESPTLSASAWLPLQTRSLNTSGASWAGMWSRTAPLVASHVAPAGAWSASASVQSSPLTSVRRSLRGAGGDAVGIAGLADPADLSAVDVADVKHHLVFRGPTSKFG